MLRLSLCFAFALFAIVAVSVKTKQELETELRGWKQNVREAEKKYQEAKCKASEADFGEGGSHGGETPECSRLLKIKADAESRVSDIEKQLGRMGATTMAEEQLEADERRLKRTLQSLKTHYQLKCRAGGECSNLINEIMQTESQLRPIQDRLEEIQAAKTKQELEAELRKWEKNVKTLEERHKEMCKAEGGGEDRRRGTVRQCWQSRSELWKAKHKFRTIRERLDMMEREELKELEGKLEGLDVGGAARKRSHLRDVTEDLPRKKKFEPVQAKK